VLLVCVFCSIDDNTVVNVILLMIDTVPDMVRRLAVTSRGSLYVHVSWEKPTRTNGILTGYVVTYRRKS